jgi:hypothetical protein
MKFEQVSACKMVGKVAASLALGAMAAAQTAGGETALFTKKGMDLTRVSMEDDIRIPAPVRRKIILDRPDGRELELVFKMHPHRGANTGALIPTLEDMESSLVLRNGTPGAVAVIELHSQAPELRRAAGTGARIVGFFDEDGKFEGQLPAGTRPRGIFAGGREVTLFGLVKKDVAGHAVPASKRPQMEEVDVEELAEQTYFDWVRAYTNLEFRTDGKVRRASLAGEQDASEQVMLLSSRSLSSGAGHAQRGKTVENDLVNGGGELIVEPPVDPQGGGRAGTKIPLQRPAPITRTLGSGGHTKPGSGVDDDLKSGGGGDIEPVLPDDPKGGRRAGEKKKLHRPPTQRDGNVEKRRL